MHLCGTESLSSASSQTRALRLDKLSIMAAVPRRNRAEERVTRQLRKRARRLGRDLVLAERVSLELQRAEERAEDASFEMELLEDGILQRRGAILDLFDFDDVDEWDCEFAWEADDGGRYRDPALKLRTAREDHLQAIDDYEYDRRHEHGYDIYDDWAAE